MLLSNLAREWVRQRDSTETSKLCAGKLWTLLRILEVDFLSATALQGAPGSLVVGRE